MIEEVKRASDDALGSRSGRPQPQTRCVLSKPSCWASGVRSRRSRRVLARWQRSTRSAPPVKLSTRRQLRSPRVSISVDASWLPPSAWCSCRPSGWISPK